MGEEALDALFQEMCGSSTLLHRAFARIAVKNQVSVMMEMVTDRELKEAVVPDVNDVRAGAVSFTVDMLTELTSSVEKAIRELQFTPNFKAKVVMESDLQFE